MMALGLVETLGLVPALEAADAMLKAADVRLLEKSYADAGLVTITVAGSVSAVQASVEAGKTYASSIGKLTALLFSLEMKGVVKPYSGGTYHLLA